MSRPTATQELRSVQANLSTGAGVVLSPGETIGFDSLIANQNKNIFYDYTTRREYYLVNSGYRGNVKMPIDSFLDVDDAYIIDIT